MQGIALRTLEYCNSLGILLVILYFICNNRFIEESNEIWEYSLIESRFESLI